MSCAIKWGVHSLLVELRLLLYAPGTFEEYHFARCSAPINQACNSADEYACYQPKWQQENDYLEDGPTKRAFWIIDYALKLDSEFPWSLLLKSLIEPQNSPIIIFGLQI